MSVDWQGAMMTRIVAVVLFLETGGLFIEVHPFGPLMCVELWERMGGNVWKYHAHNLTCVLEKAENKHDKTVITSREDNIQLRREKTKCHDDDVIVSCVKGRLGRVREVLFKGQESINCHSLGEVTLIMWATRNGQEQIVDLLLRHKADLSCVDDDGDNVLHHACGYEGHINEIVNIIRKLALAGADLEGKNNEFLTPLMLASKTIRIEVFDCLISLGSNPKVLTNMNHFNILHIACLDGDLKMVKHIMEQEFGSDLLESKDLRGVTPVYVAIPSENVKVVEVLVGKGCNILVTDYKGNTVLHEAAMYSSLEMIKYLLSLKIIKSDCKNMFYETPFILAKKEKRKDIARFLYLFKNNRTPLSRN